MKIYVLSEVVERDITSPVTYKSFDSALSELYIRMAQAFGYTESEINTMLEDIADDNDSGININYESEMATAWGQTNISDNIDWNITPIDID